MGIGDTIMIVSCLGGMLLAMPALLLALRAFFHRTTDFAAARLSKGALWPFFAGLVPLVFIGVPATILLSIGSVFQFIGTLTYLALFIWGFVGLAAFAQMLGERLMAGAGFAENPGAEMLLGAFVLTLAIAFPILGWLVALPFALVIGVGGTVLGTLQRLGQAWRPTPQAPASEMAVG